MSTTSTSSSSSSSDPIKPTPNKQVITVRHKNINCILVGTMHYNPHSIAIARDTVRNLRESQALGGVVLETCEKRWEKTQSFQPPGSFMRKLLDNEFQAAAEEAGTSAIILGDQPIADLGTSMKALAKQTLLDLGTPWDGGWARYTDDISKAVKREVKAAKGGVESPAEVFDTNLLLNVPVSLFRYPLAWLLKSPKLMVPLTTFWLTIAALPGAVESIPDLTAQSEAESLVTDLFLVLDFLQLTLLSRIFLVALLRDRNDILAASVSAACDQAKEGESIVAIVGAAHLNGVHRRLLEEVV